MTRLAAHMRTELKTFALLFPHVGGGKYRFLFNAFVLMEENIGFCLMLLCTPNWRTKGDSYNQTGRVNRLN